MDCKEGSLETLLSASGENPEKETYCRFDPVLFDIQEKRC